MSNTVYWSKTALTGGGATALDGIGVITAGDFCHTCVGNVLYVHKAVASSATESSPDVIVPDAASSCRWILQRTYSALPPGYISGLVMSHDADTEHDIGVTAGACRDSTDASDIVLGAAIVKRADAAWQVGTAQGGMDTGSIPTSGTLHVWVIKRSDTGVVDVLFSISATSPTMPTNYDYKRRIGSLITDSSANIRNGMWFGTGEKRSFFYATPVSDQNGTQAATTEQTLSLSVPSGVRMLAYLNVAMTDASASINYMYAGPTDGTDVAPDKGADACIDIGGTTGGVASYNYMRILTDTSGQMHYRLAYGHTPPTVRIATYGWEDSL